MSKAKVGLIVDDYIVSKQIFDLVLWSKRSEVYEISCLVIQDTSVRSKQSFLAKAFKYIGRHGFRKFIINASFRVILKIETQLLKKLSPRFKDFSATFNLKEQDIESIEVKPNVSKSGSVYRYTDEDLERIREKKLDILIRGGSGILRGDVLNVCSRGIISFHHANNEINRGGPPGFWEVLLKQRSTGFVIQILKDELDGGDVIYKGCVATSYMCSLNLAKLYKKSNMFMHKVLEDLLSEKSKITVYPKKPYSYPLYTTPSLLNQLRYLLNATTCITRSIFHRLLKRSHRWGVAYQHCSNWRDITLWKSRVIKNPPYRFLADPFVVARNNKHYCFVEDYDYRQKRGVISVYEITKDGHKEIGCALKEDFHLSYPFLFEDNGELYMCPETHEAKDIRIYRCIEFPLEWKLEKILISNVSACDTNIFYKDNKWWLMTNVDTSLLHDYESELHIFYSNDLLSDNWSSHEKNPVIFNSERARNGGLLFENDKVFRVFQIQGLNFYGEAFGVAQITRLTETEYSEDIEFTVNPKFIKGAKGTHTYSYNDGLMAIDYVKMENYTR